MGPRPAHPRRRRGSARASASICHARRVASRPMGARMAPPMTAGWAPTRVARPPTSSAVIGRLPRCAVWWKAITRPRTTSGTSSCRAPVRTGKHSEKPKPTSATEARATGRLGARAVPTRPTAWNTSPKAAIWRDRPRRRSGTKAIRARAEPTLWAATTSPAALSGWPRPSTTMAGARVRMNSSGALTETMPRSMAMTHGCSRTYEPPLAEMASPCRCAGRRALARPRPRRCR